MEVHRLCVDLVHRLERWSALYITNLVFIFYEILLIHHPHTLGTFLQSLVLALQYPAVRGGATNI